MAVISNLNSRQNPMAAAGLTGTQSTKWLDCPRVYVKAKDSSATPVAVKSNGTVPSGWTDLGIVSGKAKVTYTKELQEIRTGLDNVLRSQYIRQRTGQLEFSLSQFDDVVLKALSGVTESVIQAGSIYQFGIGTEDVVEKAILLVTQNKLDGKEWQFYNPAAQVTFSIEDNGDETLLKGTAVLPAFTWAGSEALFVMSPFA
jgi:hypothetical protein